MIARRMHAPSNVSAHAGEYEPQLTAGDVAGRMLSCRVSLASKLAWVAMRLALL